MAPVMPDTPSTKRKLACVLCQQRKKKCDRKSPCANCIKLGRTCTPSTPAPARKRRRPNQELLERLARCEELLRHCRCINRLSPSLTSPGDSAMGSDDSHALETQSVSGTDSSSPPYMDDHGEKHDERVKYD